VVTEKTRPRNGRFVEIVGTYDPQKKPAVVNIKAERVQYWLSKGAQPSDTVRSLLRSPKPAPAQP
jgi:small subunit ribosomal protein S16